MTTVRQVLNLYQAHSRANHVHCPAAVVDREYTFRLFVEHVGDLTVADCRPYHLAEFISAHPEWKSSATKRTKANAIRAAFNWAVEQERVERNPFRSVRYADAEPRPAMDDADFDEICAVSNKRFERALRFLRLTGLRLTEMCNLTWADVDLERAVVTIRRHKSLRYTHRPRTVPLVAEAVELLTLIRSRQPTSYAGVVFLNTRDTPWTRGTLGYQLRRVKQRHGITTKASAHGLRHRMVTAALENGAPLLMVSEAVGHASPGFTAKRYFHRSPEQLNAIREAMEAGVRK